MVKKSMKVVKKGSDAPPASIGGALKKEVVSTKAVVKISLSTPAPLVVVHHHPTPPPVVVAPSDDDDSPMEAGPEAVSAAAGPPKQPHEEDAPEGEALTHVAEKSVRGEYDADPYLMKDAEYIKTDSNWRNKQRTLMFSSRGISHQHRHLMEDLKKLLPHHKAESKFEKSQDFSTICEIAELKSCNNICFFESRRHTDLYLHVGRVPFGPTMKFQVLNTHTSGEVRLSGNCLLYSRPLLTFDQPFDKRPHLKLIKEIFIQTFGTPRNHPKSKPFHDHVMSFFYSDDKIWVRHYQISPLTDSDQNDPEKQVLSEIGPRFVLQPIWILEGCFSGRKIYHNPQYASPTAARKAARQTLGVVGKVRAEQGANRDARNADLQQHAKDGPEEDIFEESADCGDDEESDA